MANGLTGLARLTSGGISDHEPGGCGARCASCPGGRCRRLRGCRQVDGGETPGGGGESGPGSEVTRIDHTADGVEVLAGETMFSARTLVNCAGLHSDKVAALAGIKPDVRIIPFRGEYYTLDPHQDHLVKALIYPVPDPRFPFLGVHFTRRFNGSVEVGPNALIALAREQYRGVGASWSDIGDIVSWPGFWSSSASSGVRRQRVVQFEVKCLYARLARRLVPAIRPEHLTTGGAGVRGQAVDKAGRILDDFVIETAGSSVHVLNAPSPGATASLAIGGHVAGLVAGHLTR